MCDALSRNVPKLNATLVANCNAHSRRNFVEVTASFPAECRFVLETLGEVFGYDEQARGRGLSADERLHFHQKHSAEVVTHPQPEGPFEGWSQIDEERSDCLVLRLKTAPALLRPTTAEWYWPAPQLRAGLQRRERMPVATLPVQAKPKC